MSTVNPALDGEAPLSDRNSRTGPSARLTVPLPALTERRTRPRADAETLLVAAWALLLARTTLRSPVRFGLVTAAGAQVATVAVDGAETVEAWLRAVARHRAATQTAAVLPATVLITTRVASVPVGAALVLHARLDATPHVVVQYSTGRHSPGRARLIGALLAGLVADLAAAGSNDPVAGVGEGRGVRLDAALPPVAHRPVVDTVLHNGTVFAGSVAVRTDRNRVTYAELAAQVTDAAASLAAAGIRAGSRVVLLGRPTSGWVAMFLAVLRLEAVIVPLDATLPSPRLAELVGTAHATHVITTGGAAAWLTSWGKRPPVDVNGWQVVTAAMAQGLTLTGEPARDAAYIVTTSGSTGRPKAVLGSGRGLAAFLDWEARLLQAGPDDRCALLTPPHFDVAFRDLLLPLTAGATLCLPETTANPPDTVLELLDRHAVTILHAVPSRAAHWAAADRRRLPALRAVLFAGEQLTAAVVRQWRELAPHARVVNLYGPSETTLAKLFQVVGDVSGPIPVGRPIPGAAARIMRAGGRTCAAGEIGEIVIETPLRAHGYLPPPGTTVLDAQSGQPFWTGDLGVVNLDGAVEHLGRRDTQVKIHGVRIELAEVDARLRVRPDVLAAAAAVLHTPATRLVAAVRLTPRPGAEVVHRCMALRAELAAELPAAMVPLHIEAVPEIPTTTTGKIDREGVAALVADRLAASERDGRSGAAQRGPAGYDPTTRHIALIWSEVLGVDPPAGQDDFFDLGGDSVRLSQVQHLLEDRLGVEVDPLDLFSAPTLDELAEVVRIRLGHRSH
ncbi:non-ribosomal peptide synthetase [Dactylosporangium sp. NPDC051485]|uniref:non-ribosomal peptide synthetase n=1 Tax=Dactylosporangium sp. NPDC051485 TaxID=3154846 RepID=UPI0034341ECE